MKNFIEIVDKLTSEEPVLTEAQNYEAMFNPLWTFLKTKIEPIAATDPYLSGARQKVIQIDTEVFKKTVPSLVQLAKKNLKKNDRIVWFLKLVRLSFVTDIYRNINFDQMTNTDNANSILNSLDDYIAKEKSGVSMSHVPNNRIFTLKNLKDMLENLEHYFSLPIPEIQNVVFTNQNPSELLGKFSELERDWKDKQNQFLKYYPTEEARFETLIKFPDGKIWVDLKAPYCETEGTAMGHCGNRASYKEDDTVLSLREPIKHGNEIKWRPLLTFILHADGNLGEMKGRGNQKPAPQYHSYIISLLKLPLIKGISGGGYAPERNFAITDLSQEEQDALVDFKPTLGSLAYQFNRFGMTEEIIQSIRDKADSLGISGAKTIQYDANSQMFQIDEMPLKKFINDYAPSRYHNRADNSIEYAYKICSGYDFLDCGDWVSDDSVENLIDSLPDDLEKGLLRYCIKNYPNSFNEDGTLDDEMYNLLKENNDEILDEFRRAVSAGYETGTYDEIYEDLTKCLKDWSAHGFYLQFKSSDDGKHIFLDEPVKTVIKAKDFIDDLSNTDYCETAETNGDWFNREDGPTLKEPYHGWSDFSESAAIEYLKDNLTGEQDLEKLATEEDKEANESINYLRKKI